MTCLVVFAMVLLLVLNDASSVSDTLPSSELDELTYPEKFHCICSRYMLNYFRLNAFVFKIKFGIGIADTNDSVDGVEDPAEAISYYDELLRSQGHIFLAMLDELRRMAMPDSKPPEDLMQVSLYVNNFTGTTRVSVERTKTVRIQYKYLKGYKYLYEKTTAALRAFIHGNQCMLNKNTVIPDDENGKTKFAAIKELLDNWPSNVNDLNNVLSILNTNKTQMDTIFESTFARGDHDDFKPERLLFMELVRCDREHMDMIDSFEATVNLSGNDGKIILDKSWMTSNVGTDYEMGGKRNASIYELLISVRATFHQDYVVSFQQHVIVATLLPVLKCLGEYITVIKWVHPGCTMYTSKENDLKERAFKTSIYVFVLDKLRTGAKDLFEHLKKLMDLEMFPKSVQEYLGFILEKSSAVINCIDVPNSPLMKKAIADIFVEILRPMSSFRMHFSIKVKKFNVNSKAEVEETLDIYEPIIQKVGVYVVSLQRYSYIFLRALKVYSHNDMFQKAPFDLNNTKKSGYFVINNDIDKPPAIKVIS